MTFLTRLNGWGNPCKEYRPYPQSPGPPLGGGQGPQYPLILDFRNWCLAWSACSFSASWKVTGSFPASLKRLDACQPVLCDKPQKQIRHFFCKKSLVFWLFRVSPDITTFFNRHKNWDNEPKGGSRTQKHALDDAFDELWSLPQNAV